MDLSIELRVSLLSSIASHQQQIKATQEAIECMATNQSALKARKKQAKMLQEMTELRLKILKSSAREQAVPAAAVMLADFAAQLDSHSKYMKNNHKAVQAVESAIAIIKQLQMDRNTKSAAHNKADL